LVNGVCSSRIHNGAQGLAWQVGSPQLSASTYTHTPSQQHHSPSGPRADVWHPHRWSPGATGVVDWQELQ
jgi:hypothetical protein